MRFKRTLWLGVFAAALLLWTGYPTVESSSRILALPEPSAQQFPPSPDKSSPGPEGAAESRYAVAHLHTSSQCVGYLYVSQGQIRYEVVQPASDKSHSFDLSRRDLTAVQPWIFLGTPMNAAELKTARNNYHFTLLPATADLARTPLKQLSSINVLPASTLLAAINGQPVGAVTGVPTAIPSVGGPLTGASEQSAPELRYNPPANFYRSASTNPEDYSSGQVNASMQVYPFRPFGGDISQQFQRTLLREWIDPRYQESNIGAPPSFSRVSLQGAQMVLVARFLENVVGTMKEHMRVAIVANGAVAVVDLSANSASSWQAAAPPMLAALNSATVVQNSAATRERDIAPSGPQDTSFAGLYSGIKQRYMAGILGIPGTGGYTPAQHYYLLAPDGRMYSTYNHPGDVRSFDYAAAQRNDPENSGRWVRRGNQIVFQWTGPQPTQATVAISASGEFTLSGVVYSKEN